MSTAKVSIIVPCYQQADYLPSALDSVLNQTYPYWECVIVNDGSCDNTEEVVSPYLDKDNRFKYVKQSNQGVSIARNIGIAHSSGEYILPLDGDDIIEPSYIQKAIDWFDSHPETKLVYCKASLFGARSGEWALDDYDYDRFIWANCIFCSAIYKRKDYDLTQGYNPNMKYGNEDWDFWLSFLQKGDIVHRIDEVLFRYRVKELSRTTELQGSNLELSLRQIFNNHRSLYEPFCDRLVYYYQLAEDRESLKDELAHIRSSRAYRLGKLLLKPFKLIRHK